MIRNSIRNSDSLENVDVMKMPKIAKNSQDGLRISEALENVCVMRNILKKASEILIPLKTSVS